MKNQSSSDYLFRGTLLGLAAISFLLVFGAMKTGAQIAVVCIFLFHGLATRLFGIALPLTRNIQLGLVSILIGIGYLAAAFLLSQKFVGPNFSATNPIEHGTMPIQSLLISAVVGVPFVTISLLWYSRSQKRDYERERLLINVCGFMALGLFAIRFFGLA